MKEQMKKTRKIAQAALQVGGIILVVGWGLVGCTKKSPTGPVEAPATLAPDKIPSEAASPPPYFQVQPYQDDGTGDSLTFLSAQVSRIVGKGGSKILIPLGQDTSVLQIPHGALTSKVMITIKAQKTLAPDSSWQSTDYVILPAHLTFAKPATLTHQTKGLRNGTTLRLLEYQNPVWNQLGTANIIKTKATFKNLSRAGTYRVQP